MDDGIAAGKCRDRLRPQQAMSIGNRANGSHHARSDYKRSRVRREPHNLIPGPRRYRHPLRVVAFNTVRGLGRATSVRDRPASWLRKYTSGRTGA
jgi:hypothetical protein